MALPAYPNAISLSQIRTGFATSVKKFSDLYQKQAGPVYTGQVGYPFGVATNIPLSGTIRISNFSNATPYLPIARTINISSAGAGSWTVPTTVIGNLTIRAFGGGGGGGIWPSGCAGGGGGGGAQFVGVIPANTVINYTVAYGGPAYFGDSSRTARDPGDTTFGNSGDAWYMYIPGLYVGAYNMVGSVRGPGYGSTAQGAAGVTLGVGGNGATENGGTAGSATSFGGGGGGYATSAQYGSGAGGGGNGAPGSPYAAGTWPGGGGGGWNGSYPGYGANGGVIITGVW